MQKSIHDAMITPTGTGNGILTTGKHGSLQPAAGHQPIAIKHTRSKDASMYDEHARLTREHISSCRPLSVFMLTLHDYGVDMTSDYINFNAGKLAQPA